MIKIIHFKPRSGKCSRDLKIIKLLTAAIHTIIFKSIVYKRIMIGINGIILNMAHTVLNLFIYNKALMFRCFAF